MISAIHRGFKNLLDKLKQQFEQFRINPPSLTSLAAGALRLFVMVAQFFELNHDVHARLTQRLLDDGSLKGVQLHPYFEAVTFPPGFPRPSDITS